MVSFGVPARVNKANHCEISISLKPASAKVGTSGIVNGFVTIPYDATEGAANYTLIAANAHWRASVAGPNNALLSWGYFGASGTGTSTFTQITSIALLTITSTGASTHGFQAISGLPVTVTTSATRLGGFALLAQTNNSGLASPGDRATIDLKLIRALRG